MTNHRPPRRHLDGATAGRLRHRHDRPSRPPRAPALTPRQDAQRPATYDAVGDILTYTYLVTNTGNVTITGPFTVSRRPAHRRDLPGRHGSRPRPSAPARSPAPPPTPSPRPTSTPARSPTPPPPRRHLRRRPRSTPTPTAPRSTATQSPAADDRQDDRPPATYDRVGDILTYTYLRHQHRQRHHQRPHHRHRRQGHRRACPT